MAGQMLPRGGKGQGQQWGGSIWQVQSDREFLQGKLMALKMILQLGMGLCIPLPAMDAMGGSGHQHPKMPGLVWGISMSNGSPA